MRRLSLLFLLLLTSRLWATPAANGSASAWQGQLSVSPVLSVSATAPSGSNTLMTVHVCSQNGFTITGITWNGSQSFTLAGSYTSGPLGPMHTWYLVNPAVGTYALAVTMNNPYGQYSVIEQCWQGVNQTTPIGKVATNAGTFPNASPSTWTDTMASPTAPASSVFLSFMTTANNPGSFTTTLGTFLTGILTYTPAPFAAAYTVNATSTSITWKATDFYTCAAYSLQTELLDAGAAPTPTPTPAPSTGGPPTGTMGTLGCGL